MFVEPVEVVSVSLSHFVSRSVYWSAWVQAVFFLCLAGFLVVESAAASSNCLKVSNQALSMWHVVKE